MEKKKSLPVTRLLAYLRPFRAQYILASFYSLLNKAFDILPEILIGIAIDVVVKQKHSWLAQIGITNTLNQLLFLGLLMFLIMSFESIFEYLYSIGWRNLAQTAQHLFRIDTVKHVHKLDQATFDEFRSGKLSAILNDDVNQLERFLENGVNQIIQTLFSTLAIGIIFFIFAPQVALLAITPIPFILFGAFFFQKKLAPRYSEVREQAGEIGTALTNTVTGIMTIKGLTAENFELNRIKAVSQKYREANQKANRWSALLTPVIRFAILGGFLATLVYGGYLAIEGVLNVGIFGMLVFLTQRLLWPLTYLAEVVTNYQRSMACAERVLDLLDTPIKMRDSGKNLPTTRAKSDLQFENVTFSYLSGQKVFKDFSVKIPHGKTTAFVGATGSGKSTLIKLLMRFYDPIEGEIRFNGHSIQDYKATDLRRAIGLVSQDIFLFYGTIGENIAYPEKNVSKEKIIEAARLAAAHDFIIDLPKGYDTLIGERGHKLSGGQRQRIAFAREIIKNPPILILDEATSSVDNETELAIHKSLETISKNRTVIMIAHRLSTVRSADKIHVLEEGKIVESGRHDDLIKKDGAYASLWRLQTGHF